MHITHYAPRSRSLGLLGRLLDEDLGQALGGSAETVADWFPAVDIREEADSYVLTADLPGGSPDDIDVTMERGMLTIQGQRAHETRPDEQGYTRHERATGRFVRRFTLPDTANGDDITAVTRNGVLELKIPKHATLQPRKIEVAAA